MEKSVFQNNGRWYLLILALLLCPAAGTAQWTQQTSGTTAELYDIAFTDSLTGFCVGGNPTSMQAGNGIILKTIDGGTTWTTIYEDTNFVLEEVVALEDTVSVFGKTKIGQRFQLLSTDAGDTWTSNFTTYAATRAKYINGEIYLINAHLQTLERVTTSGSQALRDNAVLFTNNTANDIFALCYASVSGFVFAKSANGGANWDTSLVNFNNIGSNSLSGASLWAFGDTIIFLATYPSAIAISYNKGQTWTDTTTIFPTGDGYMTSPKVAFGSYLTTTSKTIDGCKSFYRHDTLTDRTKSFSFPDKKTGYLCGENGMIYKTTHGEDGTSVGKISAPGNQVVIYPNPINSFATLSTDISLHNAECSIYDNMGRLVKQFHFSGKNGIIDRNGIAAGMYYYKLTAGGEPVSQGKIAVQD